jgi:RNA polymerase sigma-70 factor, ECF subfamily
LEDARREFEAVVNAHGAAIFRYAFWLCGDRSMAEDLVQETLLRAWRFRDALRDQRKVKAWLITTLRRERARLFERYQPEFVDLELEQLAAPRATADNALESWELGRAIARLPERLREPLVLQVIFGCSGSEIAEMLGVPRSTVNTRLFRARRRLCELTLENSQASACHTQARADRAVS